MTKRLASPRRMLVAARVVLALFFSVFVAALVPVGAASAHTDFETSSPAAGETISDPVGVITLRFSGDTEYGDDGFTVLTPDGRVHTPTAVSTDDQREFLLGFDPPLAGGEIGVRWAVNAPDLHTISGSFSFTVTAPAVGSMGGDPAHMSETPTVDPMVMADGSMMEMPSASVSLDEFLAAPASRGGEGTARWGRLLELAAFTLLIGGAAFTVTTLRGRQSEIERAVALLRILGAVLAGAALLEYVGITRIADASLVAYWSSQAGMATLLRGAGGLAVAAGLVAITAPVRARTPSHSLSAATNSTLEYEREADARFWGEESAGTPAIDPLLRPRENFSADATTANLARPRLTISSTPPPRPRQTPQTFEQRHPESPVIRQWVLDRSSSAAVIGVGIAIISFWFDGHTVSKGVRPIHALVNSVHVVAGSVWLGGVVAMAVVLWTRHRASVAPRALEMVVRFSGIATVALGAVVAAGGIMAFLVLDSIGELFSTQWGQVLLLKSAAAGLAMVGGAYNHFRLLPALEAEPDDPKLVEHLRTAVTSEAILLGFVIIATASLVAAAT